MGLLRGAYWDSFNNEVDIVQVVHRSARSKTLAGSYSFVLGYPLLCYIFLKKLVRKLQAFVDGSLIGVDESNRH